ncbi:MAG: phosphoribosyltransferase [Spirochaetes bacterium]|nr:MAG: phosphoribosyltransferase [Spirochaetota bacterium]
MKKIFVSGNEVRDNAIKLAYRIYRDDFIPNIIYVSLRGGAYLGNVISEYFKLIRKKKGRRPLFYAAVVARSYTSINQQGAIMIDGWTYNPEHLRTGDRVLLIDDIFDSGRTINKLIELIMSKGIPREDIKVAVHDYKIFKYLDYNVPVHPDYYCKKHIIESPEENIWIHYLSHELEGLTENEKQEYYYHDDPELQTALTIFDNG